MMDYENMTDEELNEAIAKVLGITGEHLPAQYQEWVTPDGKDGGSGFYCPRCQAGESEYATRFCSPAWSTSLGAAWELVDFIESAGYHWLMKTPHQPGEKYWAGFTPHGTTGWNGRPDFYCYASTLPRAICNAFLEWKGVE